MEALGALAILAGFGLVVTGLACTVWALVHLGVRPDQQFRAAGQSKVLWVVLIVGGFVLQPIGFLSAIGYVTMVRPRVDRAAPVPIG